MRISARLITVVLLVFLTAVPAFSGAIPVRGSSRNGVDSGANAWNLFGPTEVHTITKGTTSVDYKRMVVCPNQDVTGAVDPSNTTDAGTCESGAYLFILQVRSTSTNVTVGFSDINGFTPDANAPTYGVMVCDSSLNTLELCTNATQAQLPQISFSTNAAHTSANFLISTFPKFPNGTGHQGHGITLFILTQQTVATPVALPGVVLK